jgi:Glycosyl hydrolases family 43
MLRIAYLVILVTTIVMGARTSARSDHTLATISPAWQWRPQRDGKDLRLQDFCFFEYQGKTIIASMMKDFCNQGIALARSRDLCHWETLGTALETRTAEDRSMVWAPHVVESRGVYYMFYTEVTTPRSGQWCQCILMASSKVPDDPRSWERSREVRFMVGGKAESYFRPSHPGSVWTEEAWADCRDPMVLAKDGTWYLFYTGRDQGVGICGVATAPAILGPWTDRGAVLKVPDPTIPESCFVLQEPEGGFVMVFNHAGQGGGIKVARSPSLLPVKDAAPFANVEVLEQSTKPGLKGWAHEFLPRGGQAVLSAYLTGYFITFEKARFVKESRGWTVGACPAE